MLNQTQDYFIVFDRHGFVYYETGPQPSFLNDLILKMDLNKLHEIKKVRDKYAETIIEDKIIYLCFSNNKDHLKSHIDKYKTELKKKERNLNEENLIAKLSKTFIHKSFSLFSNKIKIDELEEKVKEKLTNKNVEPEYVKLLSESLMSSFRHKNCQWINEKEFKETGIESMSKMLPSVNHKELLETIREHKENNKIFSFCFVGVNGVGKSTSLAKVAKWLLDNNLSVFIAACDTFRAGAIEQLKIHVDRFVRAGKNVGFYESGYTKDDASVASNALEKAKKLNYDVCLIDTAGRMHGNKVLMSSLSKIIRKNNPSHIIYVGEALTGNDSLDFIKEFNKSINEGREGRKVDSIILTKIDTVGDKVGQIFNLTLKSSSPILFLGCGQTNGDLIEMNGKEMSQLLLN